jgi:hypothetical protein
MLFKLVVDYGGAPEAIRLAKEECISIIVGGRYIEKEGTKGGEERDARPILR